MSELFSVSSSPHIRAKLDTGKMMLMVVIGLLPASMFGIYNFGVRALVLLLISVGTCVITEYIYEYFMKKPITVKDYSAVVTGLLLGLNLPPAVPLWTPVLGGIFAILIVKQIFGGIGQNFMNPALGARCFLTISFAGNMTNFSYTGAHAVDGISGATPLALISAGESVDLLSLFLGTKTGTIGETSIFAILIGAIFLLVIRIIDLRIPLSYLGAFSLFIILFGGQGLDFTYLLSHLLSGGLMLGVWFMASDYVTAPITGKGQIIYGAIMGILTGIFRVFGGTAEGVSYAIIIGNLLVPLIERVTIPPAFGEGRMRYE